MQNGKQKPELMVFDVGHVLVDFNWDLVCHGFAARSGLKREDLLPVMHYLSSLGYEHGRISTEAFLAELNERLHTKLTLGEFSQLWTATFEENLEMAELVQALKLQMPVCALSNTNHVHWTFLEERYNISRHFHEKVLSYEVGSAKPEPEIYLEVFKRCNITPEKCLFVDDLAKNIETASELGMQVVHFVGVEDFRQKLKEHSLI